MKSETGVMALADTGGSEGQGQPWLNDESEASLGYVRPCVRKIKC